MTDDTMSATAAARAAEYEHVFAQASRMPLKFRLRLFDALKAASTLDSDEGLRFSLESVSEFKRARRFRAAHHPLVDWIRSFTAADVFFDVGANIGWISLMAAQLHGGRVPIVAMEPAFDNFAAIMRNVLANGFQAAITPLHVALLDETGIRPLNRSGFGAGSALHAVGDAIDYARQPFVPIAVEHVLAFRLDDLLGTFGLPAPTRIKLDVDGFEHKVLAGAAETLRSTRCDVYTELVKVSPDDPDAQRTMQFMFDLGYKVAHVVEHRPSDTYPSVMDVLFTHA
jgi:FkbM family methyltransferase